MKNKCKQVREIVVSKRHDEYDHEEQILLQQHLHDCSDCQIFFEETQKADIILERIKNPVLSLDGEEYLTNSIMKKIKEEKNHEALNAFDYLIEFLSTSKVRFALGLALIICTLSFTYMEYTDTKQIVSLEQKIGIRWNDKMIYSSVIQEEEGVLKFFYNAYKLFSGKSSYMEINKELVLMKKKDLHSLFNDYNKLDESTKLRLEEMRIQFLRDTSFVRSSGFNNNEITLLQKEIERLKKELEQIINKRGTK